MRQLGPQLTKLIEDEDENLDPALKGMISQSDAVDTLIDGATVVILQKLGMSLVVAKTAALAKGGFIDTSKVRQGRVKIVEGLLLILEAESDIVEFLDEDELFGGLDITEVLREFIAYNQPEEETEEQAQ